MKSPKVQKAKPTIRFKAKLSRSPFLELPAGTSAKLPQQDTVMIEGAINYLPFRVALEQDSKGRSCRIKFSDAMRNAVGATDLDMVPVEITRVADEPETRAPSDLLKSLKKTPNALDSWSDITPLARRDWIF